MSLTTEQQMLVEQRLTNDKKSAVIAYLLWFFVGSFGAHRFYFGKVGTGIAQIILIWGGIILFVALVGIPMLIVGGLWVFIDVFLISGFLSADLESKRRDIVATISRQ